MSDDPSLTASPDPGDEAISAARGGSATALGEVFELCRRYLLQIANSEVDSRLQAKLGASDLVQETFLEAQRIFPRFQGDSPDELRAWLRAILLNKAATNVRQFRGTEKRDLAREIVIDPADSLQMQVSVETPTPSNVMMQRERAAGLQAAISRLSDDYRQIIVWRQVDDLSFEAIADRLGRSLDATRKLWWRAIQKLQDELHDTP